jgi:hypothetical protein
LSCIRKAGTAYLAPSDYTGKAAPGKGFPRQAVFCPFIAGKRRNKSLLIADIVFGIKLY